VLLIAPSPLLLKMMMMMMVDAGPSSLLRLRPSETLIPGLKDIDSSCLNRQKGKTETKNPRV
jgi:hypothetical protein